MLKLTSNRGDLMSISASHQIFDEGSAPEGSTVRNQIIKLIIRCRKILPVEMLIVSHNIVETR